MSQMATRKRTGGDEKEKRTESPVKDMKKKMAANAEKEKNAAEQATSKPDKPTVKPADKPTDKPASKSADKPTDKPAEKTPDKPQKADKAPEKPTEKKQEKAAEKKDGQSEKKKEETGKGESSAKTDKPGKPDGKPKQNGSNGVNGTVSPESDSDELVIDETDETEIFPELAYDDSDVEWEPGMDCSRSLTRRSQSKDSKVLKLSQETKTTPETPKEKKEAKDAKKADAKEAKDAKKAEDKEAKDVKKAEEKEAKEAKKAEEKETKEAKKAEAKGGKDGAQEAGKADAKKEIKESPRKEDKKEEKSDKVEVEVVVDIESNSDPSEESRKPDTNFSKSRVKVSPYRRSMRIADQTTSSMAANYTGNNTTMEMDITESSSFMDESMDDSYLSGLRSIKGRRSYKPLKEMALRSSANRSVRSVTSTIVTEPSSRPTAPVVGRKRKPEPEDNISVASEAEEVPVAGKRQRLLDRLARPFRRAVLMPARRNAEIVGINTDLPLSAPVASTSQFDPETIESLKPAPTESTPPVLTTGPVTTEDSKRCIIM